MDAGRKVWWRGLGALRRGRTSARADSPARTRFARVRRATQRGLLVTTANSDLEPSSPSYRRPSSVALEHTLLAATHSPRCTLCSLLAAYWPLRVVLGDARRAAVAAHALRSASASQGPLLSSVGAHHPIQPRRCLSLRRRRGRQRAPPRLSVLHVHRASSADLPHGRLAHHAASHTFFPSSAARAPLSTLSRSSSGAQRSPPAVHSTTRTKAATAHAAPAAFLPPGFDEPCCTATPGPRPPCPLITPRPALAPTRNAGRALEQSPGGVGPPSIVLRELGRPKPRCFRPLSAVSGESAQFSATIAGLVEVGARGYPETHKGDSVKVSGSIVQHCEYVACAQYVRGISYASVVDM